MCVWVGGGSCDMWVSVGRGSCDVWTRLCDMCVWVGVEGVM